VRRALRVLVASGVVVVAVFVGGGVASATSMAASGAQGTYPWNNGVGGFCPAGVSNSCDSNNTYGDCNGVQYQLNGTDATLGWGIDVACQTFVPNNYYLLAVSQAEWPGSTAKYSSGFNCHGGYTGQSGGGFPSFGADGGPFAFEGGAGCGSYDPGGSDTVFADTYCRPAGNISESSTPVDIWVSMGDPAVSGGFEHKCTNSVGTHTTPGYTVPASQDHCRIYLLQQSAPTTGLHWTTGTTSSASVTGSAAQIRETCYESALSDAPGTTMETPCYTTACVQDNQYSASHGYFGNSSSACSGTNYCFPEMHIQVVPTSYTAAGDVSEYALNDTGWRNSGTYQGDGTENLAPMPGAWWQGGTSDTTPCFMGGYAGARQSSIAGRHGVRFVPHGWADNRHGECGDAQLEWRAGWHENVRPHAVRRICEPVAACGVVGG
jgi:hypothetical protein